MSRGPKQPPDPGADDWQEVVAGTAPLGNTRRASGPRTPEKKLPLNRVQRDALAEVRKLPPAPALAPVALSVISNTATRLAGYGKGFDLKLFKDLADGKVAYNAMLDLHGRFEGDAYLELANWLQEASWEEHRCVLVICGKGRGYGPDRDMGILKAQLAGWLANHPAVMAFHTAQARDGGGGAVYVYLRRWR